MPTRAIHLHAIGLPLLLTFPYSAENGPIEPILPGSNYPMLVDGQIRGHRVDPFGDNEFNDVAQVRIEHIGSGTSAKSEALRGNLEAGQICKSVPLLCQAIKAIIK